jgi:hypothetical protein
MGRRIVALIRGCSLVFPLRAKEARVPIMVENRVDQTAIITEFLNVSIQGGTVKNSLYHRREKPSGGKLIISLEVNDMTTTIKIGARTKRKINHVEIFRIAL